jgi:hypothetical protein
MATITPQAAPRPDTVMNVATPTAITPAAGLTDSIVPSGNGFLVRFISTTGTPNIRFVSQQGASWPGGTAVPNTNPTDLALGSGTTRVLKMLAADYPRFINPASGLIDMTFTVNTNWTYEVWAF